MQYIGFTINANEYTIPILKVQEIVNLPQLTKLPQVPDYLEGITNLRGRIIPVVNLKKLAGLYGGDSAGEKVIVVTSGRITFGVLVDGITGVVTIDESEIEPPTDFNTSDIVSGVAKVNDKLIVLLDTKKLIPMEDVSLFEEEIFEVKEQEGDTVEVTRKLESMGGEIMVKEVLDARQFFEKRGFSAQDPRYAVFDEMIAFMNAISSQDYERADAAVQTIASKGQADTQGELFKEVGKVTRKLHDSIRSFKEALDPKLRGLAEKEMPNAIDRLQFVIEKTEEAANKTMGIVEKYTLSMDDLASHLRNIKEPEESVNFLRNFKNSLEDDLTEILTTQSFQDLTGQTIKKVITLVGEIESELVKMITTFGVKIEQGAGSEETEAEQVSQEDVDDLLKDFGF
ncbi:MAG: protein phosphatase CheZ [Thermodesulfovibrionales bacterium]